MPHLLIEPPWAPDVLTLSERQLHHIRTVLRMVDGESCTYTDGEGVVGRGTFTGGSIFRRGEVEVPALPALELAVAPPVSKDRLRFLVEKASEQGVSRIRWLRTRYGQGRPPPAPKARQWAAAALEQSQGAYLTQVDDVMVNIDELEGRLVVADLGGGEVLRIAAPVTVLVGPEGGWAPAELPGDLARVTLGERVLRTETAAILAVFAVGRSIS